LKLTGLIISVIVFFPFKGVVFKEVVISTQPWAYYLTNWRLNSHYT